MSIPIGVYTDLPGDKSVLEREIANYDRVVAGAAKAKKRLDTTGEGAAEVSATPHEIARAARQVGTAYLETLHQARALLRAEIATLAIEIAAEDEQLAPLAREWAALEKERKDAERQMVVPSTLAPDAAQRVRDAIPHWRAAHTELMGRLAAISGQMSAIRKASEPRRNRYVRAHGLVEACNGRAHLTFGVALDERHDWPAKVQRWAQKIATTEADKVLGSYGQKYF